MASSYPSSSPSSSSSSSSSSSTSGGGGGGRKKKGGRGRDGKGDDEKIDITEYPHPTILPEEEEVKEKPFPYTEEHTMTGKHTGAVLVARFTSMPTTPFIHSIPTPPL